MNIVERIKKSENLDELNSLFGEIHLDENKKYFDVAIVEYVRRGFELDKEYDEYFINRMDNDVTLSSSEIDKWIDKKKYLLNEIDNILCNKKKI